MIDDRLRIVTGDITRQDVDAMVNAANFELTRGGGVCGAIFAAAGHRLDEFVAPLDGCATGTAIITPSFDLQESHGVKWIIHAVGPVWHGGGRDEAALLAAAYRRSLEIAMEPQYGIQTIAFPAISAGIYGYPLLDAASIAVRTISEFLRFNSSLREVRMVLFSSETAAAFNQVRDDRNAS